LDPAIPAVVVEQETPAAFKAQLALQTGTIGKMSVPMTFKGGTRRAHQIFFMAVWYRRV